MDMKFDIKSLKKKIEMLSSVDNIECFLLYGSYAQGSSNPDDLDAIIVVKKIDTNLTDLFTLLNNNFKKLDINIYTKDEVINNVSFFTREFKLEYLAKGVCLIGKNIFIRQYKNISSVQYKQSILIRSIEHLQMVRQKYFFGLKSDVEKRTFMIKYFHRISRNILLFLGDENHTTVNRLSFNDVCKKLISINLFNEIPNLENLSTDELFNKFGALSAVILKLKKDFEKQKYASI